MPRPKKCRRVCRFPENPGFCPLESGEEKEPMILTVDEYEAIRLIDKEGFSQEQCSEQMQIARTTVQKIYETARRKLADVLVEGLPLKIEGGDYRLCDGAGPHCGEEHCRRRRGESGGCHGRGEGGRRGRGEGCRREGRGPFEAE